MCKTSTLKTTKHSWEELSKEKTERCSMFMDRQLGTVKMSTLLKLSCKFNKIPGKVLPGFSGCRNWQIWFWNVNNQTILKRRIRWECSTSLHYKILESYSNAGYCTVMQVTVAGLMKGWTNRSACTDQQYDQGTYTHTYDQFIFNKLPRSSKKKGKSFKNWCWNNGILM